MQFVSANNVTFEMNKDIRAILSIVNNLFIFSNKYKCCTDMLNFTNLFEYSYGLMLEEEKILEIYGDFMFDNKIYKINADDITEFIKHVFGLQASINNDEYFEDKTMTENLLYKITLPKPTDLPSWACRTMILQANIMEFIYRICLFLNSGKYDSKKRVIIELLRFISSELDSNYVINEDMVPDFIFLGKNA